MTLLYVDKNGTTWEAIGDPGTLERRGWLPVRSLDGEYEGRLWGEHIIAWLRPTENPGDSPDR